MDKKGTLGGLVLAALFLFLGKQFGILFLASMITFLVLSAIVTHTGTGRKKKLKVYEKSRGIKNVLSNGLGPFIMALIFFVLSNHAMRGIEILSIVGFMGSVAAITSDKFASEIGVLGPPPRMLLTFKKVKRGVSGGVSVLGLISSLAAAFMISLLVLPYSQYMSMLNGTLVFYPAIAVASISIGGFAGNIIDSALGYYEEHGIGNKFSTNFVCSLSGAVIAILVYIAL
ncbi:MAG: DUF92 domain-containing protein [Candidatus Micrarchaeia archaeon]